MNEVVFLGVGGGRYCMITQLRGTGGFRLHLNDLRLHIDPGPGALVKTRELKLKDLDAILASHWHTDHIGDLPVMIEVMTEGGRKKRGVLIGNQSVVRGYKSFGPLSSYYLSLPKEVIELEQGKEIDLKGIKIQGTVARHQEPKTIGFKFKTNTQIISYTSDTGFFDQLVEQHQDSDILIVNVGLPNRIRAKTYLCTEDATEFIKRTNPKLAIITHFGMRMVRADPEKEARRIQRDSGVKTIAATDGLRLNLEKIGEQETLKRFK